MGLIIYCIMFQNSNLFFSRSLLTIYERRIKVKKEIILNNGYQKFLRYREKMQIIKKAALSSMQVIKCISATIKSVTARKKILIVLSVYVYL